MRENVWSAPAPICRVNSLVAGNVRWARLAYILGHQSPGALPAKIMYTAVPPVRYESSRRRKVHQIAFSLCRNDLAAEWARKEESMLRLERSRSASLDLLVQLINRLRSLDATKVTLVKVLLIVPRTCEQDICQIE